MVTLNFSLVFFRSKAQGVFAVFASVTRNVASINLDVTTEAFFFCTPSDGRIVFSASSLDLSTVNAYFLAFAQETATNAGTVLAARSIHAATVDGNIAAVATLRRADGCTQCFAFSSHRSALDNDVAAVLIALGTTATDGSTATDVAIITIAAIHMKVTETTKGEGTSLWHIDGGIAWYSAQNSSLRSDDFSRALTDDAGMLICFFWIEQSWSVIVAPSATEIMTSDFNVPVSTSPS